MIKKEKKIKDSTRDEISKLLEQYAKPEKEGDAQLILKIIKAFENSLGGDEISVISDTFLHECQRRMSIIEKSE